jgi:hypothetical protein
MDFDEIVAKQGWNDQSVIWVLREFITRKGLHADLADFAQEKADEETGQQFLAITYCRECGDSMFIDILAGTSHHGRDDAIDYDQDADHTAVADQED